MNIIKNVVQVEYLPIRKLLLQDSRISLEARGLLAFLMTLDDGFEFNVQSLREMIQSNGRDSITSAVNELVSAGYIQRNETRDESGKFIGFEWIVRDAPLNLSYCPHPSDSGFSVSGFTDSEEEKKGKTKRKEKEPKRKEKTHPKKEEHEETSFLHPPTPTAWGDDADGKTTFGAEESHDVVEGDSVGTQVEDDSGTSQQSGAGKGKNNRPVTPYKEVVSLYNSICTMLPAVRGLSKARKRAITARMKDYSLEDIEKLFSITAHSSFLCGKNSRGWRADFDWLMNDTNIVKVLEGKYNDRAPAYNHHIASDIESTGDTEDDVELIFD